METAQPKSNHDANIGDDISYVDSDTHARQFCCCLHGWVSGPDPRWYYPWDKGVYRLFGLCCMWYSIAVVFPCSLCIKSSRDILCCADQGGCCVTQDRVGDSNDADDDIAEV